MFNVPVISNFVINDNIPEGTQNRVNGFAEPGEMIVLETSTGERLRLQYDDEYIVFAEEEAIFPDYTLSYSVIKISEDAPVGHQVTFLTRLEEYDASIELTGYTWKKLTLEISDHTSAKNIPEFEKPQDNYISVYPNPVLHGQFTLELMSEIHAGELSLKIMDINGRTVFSTTIVREENISRYLITPGEKLNHGLYIISVESIHFISKTKLMIQ
jgi:hypothetical protein